MLHLWSETAHAVVEIDTAELRSVDGEALESASEAAGPVGGDGRFIFTVGDLSRRLKRHLEDGTFANIWVAGEISNITYHTSGHVYLTLKDEFAAIDCAFFRGKATKLKFRLEKGQQVEAFGSVGMYEKRGSVQLIIDRILPAGQGELQVAFEQMKKRLELEGLFDPARKRPIPGHPAVVGIVTSPTGAALFDMLRTTRVHFPRLHHIIYPARVQGEGAADEVARAIALANLDGRAEILIVGRGGGSAEDLWTFNEERVARAIAGSAIPVISAVGHEVDYTIADFAADWRCATPTAAAELVSMGKKRLAEQRIALGRRTAGAMWGRLRELRARLTAGRPQRLSGLLWRLLRDRQQEADGLQRDVLKAARESVHGVHERFVRAALRLQALSPFKVLERGFAVVKKAGTAVTEADALSSGDRVELVFFKGKKNATIQ